MFKITTTYIENLSDDTKKLIEGLASWQINPNPYQISGRGVKIDNKLSVLNFDKIKLSKIKINGIGYQKFKNLGDGFLEKYGDFIEPSMENILDSKPSNFTTTFPNKNKIQNSYGTFEPSGCYYESDLDHILSSHNKLKNFKSKHLKLLKILGYGYYEDKNMIHKNLKGSFIFTLEPDSPRLLASLNQNGQISIFKSPISLIQLIKPLILGLKDLHNFGFAHLQPHLDNLYIENDFCYLVDLETLFENSGDKIEFTIARTLDIVVLMSNYGKNLKFFKMENYSFKYLMYDFLSKFLSLYLNKEISTEFIENNKCDMKLRPQIMELERKSGDVSDMENIFDILYHNLK